MKKLLQDPQKEFWINPRRKFEQISERKEFSKKSKETLLKAFPTKISKRIPE